MGCIDVLYWREVKKTTDPLHINEIQQLLAYHIHFGPYVALPTVEVSQYYMNTTQHETNGQTDGSYLIE